MIDPVAALTLGFAFASAGSRGAISVIDRQQFGIRRYSVALTNVLNNIAAAVICFLILIAFEQIENFKSMLFEKKVIAFGILLQLTATAFSYAFRQMRVQSITVASKFADIFIAPMIYLVFARWNTADFFFAVATFSVCAPIFWDRRNGDGFQHVLPGAMVCAMLVLQGALSPWYMNGVTNDRQLWLPFTTALIFWRLLFSIFLAPPRLSALTQYAQSLIKENVAEFTLLLVLRALLTITAQGFLVIALSFNRPILAWPILNATGLIAAFLSTWLLNERTTFGESVAIVLIAAIGVAKIIL